MNTIVHMASVIKDVPNQCFSKLKAIKAPSNSTGSEMVTIIAKIVSTSIIYSRLSNLVLLMYYGDP